MVDAPHQRTTAASRVPKPARPTTSQATESPTWPLCRPRSMAAADGQGAGQQQDSRDDLGGVHLRVAQGRLVG